MRFCLGVKEQITLPKFALEAKQAAYLKSKTSKSMLTMLCDHYFLILELRVSFNETIAKRISITPIGIADKLILAQITFKSKFEKLGIFDAANLKSSIG